MAVTTTNSNHYKYQLATGKINFTTDVFRAILMRPSFVFNKDTHATYADVITGEIATGNGYTQGTITLAGVSLVEDDTNDRCYVTWDNFQVVAVGGSIEDFSGLIIFDDTTVDNSVVFYTDFDTIVTLTTGLHFVTNSIAVQIA
jgi:hypothetical protein